MKTITIQMFNFKYARHSIDFFISVFASLRLSTCQIPGTVRAEAGGSRPSWLTGSAALRQLPHPRLSVPALGSWEMHRALFLSQGSRIQPSVQAVLRGCSPGNQVKPHSSPAGLRRALLRGCLPQSPALVCQLPRPVRLALISPNTSLGEAGHPVSRLPRQPGLKSQMLLGCERVTAGKDTASAHVCYGLHRLLGHTSLS